MDCCANISSAMSKGFVSMLLFLSIRLSSEGFLELLNIALLPFLGLLL